MEERLTEWGAGGKLTHGSAVASFQADDIEGFRHTEGSSIMQAVHVPDEGGRKINVLGLPMVIASMGATPAVS